MKSLELLSLSQSFVLSILRDQLSSSMPCHSLSFPETIVLEQHQLNELYVVMNYQNHLGIVALSISPFLVIYDNIQIKASTNDNKHEIYRRFEKYVTSKSSPLNLCIFKICFGLQMHKELESWVTLPCHIHLGGALKMMRLKCMHSSPRIVNDHKRQIEW